LALVAAMVDTLSSAALAQLVIDERNPPLARFLHPLVAVKRAALGCSAARGIGRIRTAKPLLARARDPVVLPLRNHHVRVRIVLPPICVSAGVYGERVRQLLVGSQLLRERVRQRNLIVGVELSRERKVRADI